MASQAASARPDHAALVVGATRWTWSDLDRLTDAAAAGFRTTLDPGDRVGLVLGNRWEFVVAYLGALRAGMVAVPLNPGFTPAEIASCLGDAAARLVVADHDTVAQVERAGLAADVLVAGAVAGRRTFDDLLAAGSAAARRGLPPVESGGEDIAVIGYTSGTTGEPRGAMLSHRALLANVRQVAGVTRDGQPLLTSDDVVAVVLPLAHIYTLNGTVGAWLARAATLVLIDYADPAHTLRLLREHHVTHVPAAPPQWAAWSRMSAAAEVLSSARVLFSGAAALPAPVWQRLQTLAGHTAFEGYGLTEAAPGVTSTFVSLQPKAGSVGQEFPGVELRLVDEHGQDAVAGDPGEITIRGENLFSGYWPDGSDGPGEDGWFATGDIAYRDDDGDLFLVDRRKDLVIVNGFNVYPREVEQALLSSAEVAEAAVVGVPDERSGEAVKAYLVLTPAALAQVGTSDEALDAVIKTIRAQAARRLARFKRPHIIEVVDELPHAAMGKVAKRQLRDQP